MKKRSIFYIIGTHIAFMALLLNSAFVLAANDNDPEYLIIAHPSIAETTLTHRNLAKIYALQMGYWSNGHKVEALTFSVESRDFKSFCRSSLNLQPYQLQRVWNRLRFTGVGKPPIEVSSPQQMLDKVRTTKGSIGYVKNATHINLQGVKVIKVEK